MDVIDRIDRARGRWNVLEHSFYRRWSAGELSAEELALYCGQYRHAVVALADASQALACKAPADRRAGLERHAAEEASHVALWGEFVEAAGGEQAEALPQTERCVEAWTAGIDELERLAVLYAVESGQPQIAKTKLEGLVERYGYDAEGPATEYFRLHSTLDVEHADQARQLIERLLAEEPEDGAKIADRMVARAEAALRGNWQLLDGVEQQLAGGR